MVEKYHIGSCRSLRLAKSSGLDEAKEGIAGTESCIDDWTERSTERPSRSQRKPSAKVRERATWFRGRV